MKPWKVVVTAAKPATAPDAVTRNGPLVNAGQVGYFRSAYSPALWAQLMRIYGQLKPDDQLGLIYDSRALGETGYAPITDLLVAQFEQALDRRPLGRRTIVDASVRGGIVDLELRSACRLRITVYRLDALYRTHTRELFDRQVEPGTHSAALDARSARSRNAFVVIRADDETVALAAG